MWLICNTLPLLTRPSLAVLVNPSLDFLSELKLTTATLQLKAGVRILTGSRWSVHAWLYDEENTVQLLPGIEDALSCQWSKTEN